MTDTQQVRGRIEWPTHLQNLKNSQLILNKTVESPNADVVMIVSKSNSLSLNRQSIGRADRKNMNPILKLNMSSAYGVFGPRSFRYRYPNVYDARWYGVALVALIIYLTIGVLRYG